MPLDTHKIPENSAFFQGHLKQFFQRINSVLRLLQIMKTGTNRHKSTLRNTNQFF